VAGVCVVADGDETARPAPPARRVRAAALNRVRVAESCIVHLSLELMLIYGGGRRCER
jgi:hypothetical protein